MSTHSTRPAEITSPITSLEGGYLRTIPVALIVGAIGIGMSLMLSGVDFKRFSFIYLTNYLFLLSIVVGCLFFVTIMHLTRAGWSVTVRRIAELYAACITPMFLLFLPILIPVFAGQNTVYSWVEGGWSVHDAAAAAEIATLEVAERPPLEELKHAYLNSRFFTIRTVLYFLVWSAMAWFFLRTSLKQDKTGEKRLTSRMQAFAAPLMIVFAAVLVFSSFDFEMSLSPLWFSTMFPVYFFAGAVGSALATICLTALWLQRTGRVTDEITIEHYHDLGKLMFAFVVFWGYIAFSQFLLIWYANIPEETFWYDIRINYDGWRGLSILLLVGHLFIPFLVMMGRTFKRNKTLMACACIYMLVMHWVDHYWLVMPEYNPSGHEFIFNPLVDLSCTIGMVAVFIAMFCLIARNHPLVPLQDPRLGEALNHEVH
jgi:hypothetical protein